MVLFTVMKAKLKRTVVFLEPEQVTALQQISESTGARVTEIVRRAIKAYLLARTKTTKEEVT